MRILLLTSDTNSRRTAKGLKALGHECTVLNTPKDMIAAIRSDSDAQLALIHDDTPSETINSGLNIVRDIRQKLHNDIPVIVMATDLAETKGPKIAELYLKAGADDVIYQPSMLEELHARIHSVLKRTQRGQNTLARDLEGRHIIKVGQGLIIDLERNGLLYKGHDINLTNRECSTFTTLVENRGRILSKNAILRQVYPVADHPREKIIDVYIAKTRKKISDAMAPDYRHIPPKDIGHNIIQTIWGKGYMVPKRNKLKTLFTNSDQGKADRQDIPQYGPAKSDHHDPVY